MIFVHFRFLSRSWRPSKRSSRATTPVIWGRPSPGMSPETQHPKEFKQQTSKDIKKYQKTGMGNVEIWERFSLRWGTDTYPMHNDQLSYVLGRKGSTRQKLARASGTLDEHEHWGVAVVLDECFLSIYNLTPVVLLERLQMFASYLLIGHGEITAQSIIILLISLNTELMVTHGCCVLLFWLVVAFNCVHPNQTWRSPWPKTTNQIALVHVSPDSSEIDNSPSVHSTGSL